MLRISMSQQSGSYSHYDEDTFPYGAKHRLEGRPQAISYDEYVAHFRPRIRVAKNKAVTAPKFNVAGLCLHISRHKKQNQKKVKIKPFGSEEIKKVPLGSVYGLPELHEDSSFFLRDTRTNFWYKGIAPMSGEGLKVDAVMVPSYPFGGGGGGRTTNIKKKQKDVKNKKNHYGQ